MTDSPSRGETFVEAVRAEFDLAPHADELVEQAGRMIDTIDALDEVVAAEGLEGSSSQGKKAHWALVEARHTRLALHKIAVSLDLPIEV